MRKHCPHGAILPRGLKCDRGYLVLTVRHKGRLVDNPGCGPHNAEAQVYAVERLGAIRSEILRGKFGYMPDLPEKTFKEVVNIYFKYWPLEREGDGSLKHSAGSVADCKSAVERNLIPYFGNTKFHEIRSIDIEKRRDARLAGVKGPDGQWITEPVLGTTVNREHSPLGSIFSHIETWMALEKIPKFKIPAKNPCLAASKAEMRTHERLLTDYEIQKLRLACFTLKDPDAWEICKMILKSVLSVGDLKNLDVGQTINLERGKTGVPINIPITVLQKLNWTNWRTRWERVRQMAGFSTDKKSKDYVDAKVLRKTGINEVRRKLGIEAAGNYAGHASSKTTERHYKVVSGEENRPAAEHMTAWVDGLEKEGNGERAL